MNGARETIEGLKSYRLQHGGHANRLGDDTLAQMATRRQAGVRLGLPESVRRIVQKHPKLSGREATKLAGCSEAAVRRLRAAAA